MQISWRKTATTTVRAMRTDCHRMLNRVAKLNEELGIKIDFIRNERRRVSSATDISRLKEEKKGIRKMLNDLNALSKKGVFFNKQM